MKYAILLLEPIAPGAEWQLAQAEDIIVYKVGQRYDEAAITAVLTRGKGKVDKSFIAKHSALKVIGRCGVGLDNIDIEVAKKKGIQVLNTPGINARTVAEHTMTLLLMLQRQVRYLDEQVKKGNWACRTTYNGDEVYGKKLGILGMGHIGQRVARLAEAFGMEVQYYNRTQKNLPYNQIDFDELLSSSDIITIHLPLQDDTFHLIDENALKKMKSGVFLINTARGAIVAENHLINNLHSGQLRGYATDNLEFQPPRENHPLFSLGNVLITPHAASLTQQTFEEICQVAVGNILKYLRGQLVEKEYRVNSV